MALNMQRGTLAKPVQFKCMGKVLFKQCPAGHPVRYSRSPTNPGEFVVWADSKLRWYLRIPAIQLQDIVKG